MNKTVIALTTGLFLASGAAAFADSSLLDVQDLPPRTTSPDLVPSFGSTVDDSAQNATFHGVDYTPTAAIDGLDSEYLDSPQYR